jgi:hypothetical protein
VHEWREGAGFWVEVEVEAEVEVRIVRALARGEEGKSFIVWDESGWMGDEIDIDIWWRWGWMACGWGVKSRDEMRWDGGGQNFKGLIEFKHRSRVFIELRRALYRQ